MTWHIEIHLRSGMFVAGECEHAIHIEVVKGPVAVRGRMKVQSVKRYLRVKWSDSNWYFDMDDVKSYCLYRVVEPSDVDPVIETLASWEG